MKRERILSFLKHKSGIVIIKGLIKLRLLSTKDIYLGLTDYGRYRDGFFTSEQSERLRSILNASENKVEEILSLLKENKTEADALVLYLLFKMKNPLPLEVLIDAVCEIKNAHQIYWAAREIPGAPIDKLGEAMAQTRAVNYIMDFAEEIPGAPIDKLADGIIETGKAYYIYKFAKDISNAPIDKLADGIIETGDVEYIYEFAKDIPNAPIDKLAEAIIATKNIKYIYLFARDVSNAPVEKLVLPIIALGEAKVVEEFDAKYIWNFAAHVPGAPIEKLEQIIIEIGNPDYIYEFALNVPNASIENLADSIIKTGDASDIYYFAKDIPNAPIGKLADAFVEAECDDNSLYRELFIELVFGDILSERILSIFETTDINSIDDKINAIYDTLVQVGSLLDIKEKTIRKLMDLMKKKTVLKQKKQNEMKKRG